MKFGPALLRSSGALVALLTASDVEAQSTCQYIIQFGKPSLPQWTYCFTIKQNLIPYPTVNTTGSNLTGRLVTTPSSSIAAPLNIPAGIAPSTPVNGDIWTTGTGGVLLYVGGATLGPLPTVANNTYVLRSGSTLTGELAIVASGTAGSGFNIQSGVAPTSPNPGDFWFGSNGFTYDQAGVVTIPFPTAGGTMLGELVTLVSGTAGSGFNLQQGTAPAAPVNGDLWITPSGLYVEINNSTVGPIGIPPGCAGNTCMTSGGGTMTGKFTAATMQVSGSIGFCPNPPNGAYIYASCFDLPQGAAPASPHNGDIWTTNIGAYAQINGSTVGPFMGLNGGPVLSKLAFAASGTGGALLNINASSNITPTSPITGDVWDTSLGEFNYDGASKIGPLTSMPRYNPAGTRQYGEHQVTGTVTIPNTSQVSVNLAGGAAFTSAVSYVCIVTVQNNHNTLSVQQSSGSSFTIYRAFPGIDTYKYFCIGS